MNQQIDDKVKELFENTPTAIGVGYGLKRINGELTNEESIVFSVEKKLPLSEIPEGDILPSEITIGDKIYRTDVIEVGKIVPLQYCTPPAPNVDNNCYSWVNYSPNEQTFRPLRGGVSVTSTRYIGLGTLGFLALDSTTNALVGVSNNHVLVGNGLYTSDRALTPPFANEINDYVFQTGELGTSNPSLIIGQVVRYVPLFRTTTMTPPFIGPYNQVDGCLTSISQSVVDNFSYRIFGLTGTTPMPFATTAEIDGILGNTTLASSGRSSGAKQGPNCGLVATSVNKYITVGPYFNGSFYSNYSNTIEFTRINPNCIYPIYPGDSGSVLIAQIGGIDKIVGLVFAGGANVGYAARIDFVASQLGIKAWMGETPKYVNPSSIKLVTQIGGSNQINITCNGKTLWQGGLTNQAYTC